MSRASRLSVPLMLVVLAACGAWLAAQAPAGGVPPSPVVLKPLDGERHLANIRQLTFGGENAEAYFSRDGRRLVFQSTRGAQECDQIYTMNVDGSDVRPVSSGQGRTTCGYFTPDGQHIVYASTHLGGKACPPRPDLSRGYVWPIFPTYDIFRAALDGSGLTALTSAPGYDAEATVAPNGDIVFTSVRDGDMEVYSMKADGSGVRRLTNRPGPDGGPFFSWDGSLIAWRGKHITDARELEDYRALLQAGQWRPTDLEIFVMNADGSGVRQVTDTGGSSFAPFIHPDNKRLVFSSNEHDPKGRNFDLYLVNLDGSGRQRVTFNDTFDGFPMFSTDGKKLVFASNRNDAKPGETNIFVADWID